jgi:flagellar hook-length control protein FliK
MGGNFQELVASLLESFDGDLSALFAAILPPGQQTAQSLEIGNQLPLQAVADGKSLPLLNFSELSREIRHQLARTVASEATTLSSDTTKLQQFFEKQSISGGIGIGAGERLSLEGMQQFQRMIQSPRLIDSTAESPYQIQSPASSEFVGRQPLQLAPKLEIPVGQPGWDRAMGERVQWMVSRNLQSAEVKLTPPNLGPLEIRLSVQNDQAHVQFLAPQAATREALEAAIPRLREMLGEVNLNLANVDVGQHGAENADPGGTPSGQGGRDGGGRLEHGADSSPVADLASPRVAIGLVDDYV